jgi:hypothetical protein
MINSKSQKINVHNSIRSINLPLSNKSERTFTDHDTNFQQISCTRIKLVQTYQLNLRVITSTFVVNISLVQMLEFREGSLNTFDKNK